MKNIRYIYQFHFHGKGIDTEVEIKAETLRDLYFKILDFEPALQRLDNMSWNCSTVQIHKRSIFPVRKCHNHTHGFLPHDLMPKREYELFVNGKYRRKK